MMMKTKTTIMTMMITIKTIMIAKYKINHHDNYFLALFTNVNSSKPNCTMCKLTSFFLSTGSKFKIQLVIYCFLSRSQSLPGAHVRLKKFLKSPC